MIRKRLVWLIVNFGIATDTGCEFAYEIGSMLDFVRCVVLSFFK